MPTGSAEDCLKSRHATDEVVILLLDSWCVFPSLGLCIRSVLHEVCAARLFSSFLLPPPSPLSHTLTRARARMHTISQLPPVVIFILQKLIFSHSLHPSCCRSVSGLSLLPEGSCLGHSRLHCDTLWTKLLL